MTTDNSNNEEESKKIVLEGELATVMTSTATSAATTTATATASDILGSTTDNSSPCARAAASLPNTMNNTSNDNQETEKKAGCVRDAQEEDQDDDDDVDKADGKQDCNSTVQLTPPAPDGVQLERNRTIRPVPRHASEPGAFHVAGVARDTPEEGEGNEEAENLNVGVLRQRQISSSFSSVAVPLDAHLVVEEEADVERSQDRSARSSYSNDDQEDAQVVNLGDAIHPAHPLVEGKAEPPHNTWMQQIREHRFLVVALVFLVIVALVLAILLGVYNHHDRTHASGSTIGNGNNKSAEELGSFTSASSSTTETNYASLSTLEKIRQRGHLRCGYREYERYFFRDENGTVQGFEAAMCQAVGAAVFGPSPPIEFINITGNTRYPFVADDKIDLMSRLGFHTMNRDVFEAPSETGFSFSVPYKYEGMKFAGDPFYINNCTELNFKHIDECSGIKICTGANTTSIYFRISQLFPERFIVPLTTTTEIAQQGFMDGKCNVVGHMSFVLEESYVREAGFQGDYVVGSTYISKSPSAITTRQDDPEFSDFVNAVVLSLFHAEEMNITQATADEFPETLLFGEEYKHMFQHAIRSRGNYGEIYQRFLGDDCPRELDSINNGSTGLLSSLPLGDVSERRNETQQPLGEILQQILLRGKLLCGVRLDRPGFATLDGGSDSGDTSYAGMDVDYCRALSASLFEGDDTSIEFVALQDVRDGATLLANGELDVVAGATWTLDYDVRESSTGLGFAFSNPYFYAPQKGSMTEEENLCFMTRQEDPDWTSFAYWIVESVVYAEEQNITRVTSNRMPEVFLYGNEFNRIFRDAILAIGNYAEVYDRNLAPSLPRSGRNLLNPSDDPGPQIYIPPWVSS